LLSCTFYVLFKCRDLSDSFSAYVAVSPLSFQLICLYSITCSNNTFNVNTGILAFKEPGFQIIQFVQVDSKTCSKTTVGPNYSPGIFTGRNSPSRSVHWLDQSASKCSPSGAGSRHDSMHSTPPGYSSSGSPYKCSSTGSGYFLGTTGGRSSPSACPRLDTSSGSLSTSYNCQSLVTTACELAFVWQ